jgi:hypothetical protein
METGTCACKIINDTAPLGSFVRSLVRLPSLRRMTSQFRILARFRALAAFLVRPAHAHSGEFTVFPMEQELFL